MNSVTLTKKSKKIMDEITEKLMEKLHDMVNQKVQDELKNYQDTTNKKLENPGTGSSCL
jgi:ABC-type transporter MlaC component